MIFIYTCLFVLRINLYGITVTPCSDEFMKFINRIDSCRKYYVFIEIVRSKTLIV